jgi:transposase-like protein
MAQLTKADAARQLGIARSTLYKLIAQGKVSATPDGMIDQAELVRVAAYVDTLKERTRTSVDTLEASAQRHAETPYGRPRVASQILLRRS